MNSLRIAVTGLLIKYYGPEVADGFLHEFEGWFVFMVSCLLLVLVLLAFALISRRSISVLSNFKLADAYEPGQIENLHSFKRYYAMFSLVVLGGVAVNVGWILKADSIPEREIFSSFPLTLEERDFYPDKIDPRIEDILKADDYIIGDYLARGRTPVNIYLAYYSQQKEGSLIHSPEKCIPAGGWKILSKQVIDLSDLGFSGFGNRLVIEKSGQKLLVYFWVNQQGGNYANDGDVYKALVTRSILYGRTDATLIRLFIPFNRLGSHESELKKFANEFSIASDPFLPN